MKGLLKWIISCMILFVSFGAVAQTDEQLAEEYFKKGDCEKAVSYYSKILRKAFDKRALKNYTTCLVKAKDWDEADKFFKRQVKSDAANAAWYYINWGLVSEAEGKSGEADKKFGEAVGAFGTRFDLYRDVAEEFRELQKPQLAKQTLLRAREASKNENLYRLEMASLNHELKETENMIGELLAYGIMFRNAEIVQNMLQDFLKEEKEQALLEKVLYDKIQKNPNEAFYNELLVWYQVQRKDFYKAFLQERALDKRYKYNGSRIYDLGNLALQNKDYENAASMFEYLVKEYPKGQLYPFARRMAITAREEQVKNTFPVKTAEVQKLIGEYEKLLTELGTNERTLEALRNMAMLHAFYLDDKQKAIGILTRAIEVGKQEKNFVDKCKLDLGDIYLLQSEPWEATLLYSQVEKSQKDDLLGYEAKLRNAKLHYYKGDFALSKEVLDILKRATTREIANDANSLSLLIMDNTGLDSSETAMQAYAATELLLFQNKPLVAIDSLKSLYAQLKDHSLADEILWLTAKTYMKLDSNQQALACLKTITEKYNYDILGDDALFATAKLYEEKLNSKEEAMKLYQEVLEKYPGSIFIAEARKRYRTLRGDTIN
ncbi:tetratricopeptide repeat protein [Telluribacter sp. SYSU D00476]|uniref:tetratricopeptide repeat protein n=1 Tax=Telluribacter sp. SYSU D00476 TaxID=2811430 RepID=UPI001FF4FEFA|nr:tetratricopeptide repeat protein [Telluribacter sp. SYSU D00476]